ncbi:chromate efflux transporter [Dawidia soli]|uniref:Chromate efflux transporter n=1 Tax=Dawidia soli TaxID=2782352 RepID=A0AAP2DGA3_9BACT|nr:chromate efflux transporter [Dawidia soli]MBT1688812.1 chromate efflux transporter [Dawidia soli]
MIRNVRYYIFLKDVLMLAVTTFGGPQAHLAHFQKILVDKRKYLSEEDLLEINSLCQILPGPTSTQTLTAIGFKIGGPNLAYLTLILWILPGVTFMTLAAMMMSSIEQKNWSTEFTRFIQPMAVGFVSYGAYMISVKTIHTKTGMALMILAAVLSYFIQTPFIFPVVLLCSGLLTALKYKAQPKEEKTRIVIPWANFLLWAGVLIVAAVLGGITKALPVRLFENFYRNGSLIFGGGQVLTPLLYTEFVQYAPKQYLSSEEFLSGYAVAQSLPGPVFSFSSYIGALSMREYGKAGELLGGFVSALGIFLPGTFLIFFVIRFWESLKKYRAVRASLEGITAASAGLVIASAVILFQPLENTVMNFAVTIITFALLAFTRLPSPLIILGGLLLGFVLR